MADNKKIGYIELFEMQVDFDDAELGNEASKLIDEQGLGPIDAMSYAAFS